MTQPENPGFAGGANIGASSAIGDVLVFLNPDTEVESGSLGKLRARLIDHPGVAGPAIVSDESVDYGATLDVFAMPRGLHSPKHGHSSPMYAMGCCLATNHSVFDRMRGFDERYFMFCEDAEYSWQCLRHGYAVEIVSDARIYHKGGASTPGGYLRGGRIEVTAFRISLRERNSTAMVIACAPGFLLPIMLILSLVRSLAVGTTAAFIGRTDLASSVFKGMLWNLRQLSGTLERRRSAPMSTASNGWTRIRWRCFAIELVIRRGLPVMVDFVSSDSTEQPNWSPGEQIDGASDPS